MSFKIKFKDIINVLMILIEKYLNKWPSTRTW